MSSPTPSRRVLFGSTPTTPIGFRLQSNRTIKVLKQHCVFYDLLIKRKIDEILRDSDGKSYSYYKELFEEQYDDSDANTTRDSSAVSSFFGDNNLTSGSDSLMEYFGDKVNKNQTLFIIPTFLNDNESANLKDAALFHQEEKLSKLREYKIYEDFNSEITNVNIYYFPCIVKKSDKIKSEQDYIELLRKELNNLQEYLKSEFLERVAADTFFRNIQFFCDPNGNISLDFYKKKFFSQKYIDLLNKHLFKEIAKMRGDIQEGTQSFVVVDKVSQPLIYKKTKYEINKMPSDQKFFTFLLQEILVGDILSELKITETIDNTGIRELSIIFKTKYKEDLNDFEKIYSTRKYRFYEKNIKGTYFDIKFDSGGQDKKDGKENRFDRYRKITDINQQLPYEAGASYLRITSSNVLKSASLYLKRGNIYEEKKKGILQLLPSESEYKAFKVRNLSRTLESSRIYYYENFNFTMESFQHYLKQNKELNAKRDGDTISKENLRERFISTFTRKNLLKDYFFFCMNEQRFKKTIDFEFYKQDKTEEQKQNLREKIIKRLVKELFKKGSAIFINNKKNETSELANEGEVRKGSYNTYKIKRVDQNKLLIQLYANNNTTGSVVIPGKVYAEISRHEHHRTEAYRAMIEGIQGTKNDYALVHLRLEKDEHKSRGEDNNAEDNSFSGKPTTDKKNCLRRKKTIKNALHSMMKNVSQKARFKLRAFL